LQAVAGTANAQAVGLDGKGTQARHGEHATVDLANDVGL
jgi:hypothetical protein